MLRSLIRATRKRKKAIQLLFTSAVFFLCLNVSVRNYVENSIELVSDDIDGNPSNSGQKGPYFFSDELLASEIPSLPSEKDIPSVRPICNNLSDDARNAIKRAKTNNCKQMIADQACKLSGNQAIPRTVHNTCKRTECHCGYKISAFTELDFRSCNIVCPGNQLQNCGGDLAINVYSTGVSEIEEAKEPESDTAPAILAFHIGVNGRKLRQIKQMLQAIYSPKHYYLIHVDARQTYLYGELQKLEEKFPNIRMQKQRIKGIWGAPSLYQILRTGMIELLDWATDWDFYINLSESCFPVQKLDVIEKYYGANKGRNFFWSYANFPENRLSQNRLKEHFVECDNYVFDIGDRGWPSNLRVDSGADWYTMHRGFVSFVSDRTNPLIPQLEAIQNYSFVPTENFFHMALQNSEYCGTRINNNHRLLNWGDFPDGQCNHYEYGDYGGCSPRSFRYEDLPRLTNIKDREYFFARKFDNSVSQGVMTALEEHVFGSWPDGTQSLENFWENVYHHQYDRDPSMEQFSRYLFSFLYKLKKIDFVEKPTVISGLDEVNTYFDDDRYQGTLLRYKVKNPSLDFEVYLRPKRQMVRPDMRRLEQGRLKFLRIGAEYNKKERMFKNQLLYIDSRSKVITLEHMWEISEKTEKVTFYWIGPSNNIFNMSEVEIKPKQEMTFLIFNTKMELQPGVWSLLIETFGNLVGYVDFPVFPAGQNTPMNNPTSVLPGAAKVSGEINEFLSSRAWPEFYTHRDMTEFLIKRFYKVVDSCILSNDQSTKSVIKSCRSSDWSSLTPDPKSEFKRLVS